MLSDDTLIFVDGENLWHRYQDLLKGGRTPRPDNIVIDGCFVWNNRTLERDDLWKVKRLSYYTSTVGDDKHVREVKESISAAKFRSTVDRRLDSKGAEETWTQTGQIVPFVRKKSSKSNKESICDIAIAVDTMRSCYRDHAKNIWIFSGDGDFIKLFEEIVHSGKSAYAAAFSSGLHPEIKFSVDEFFLLDEDYFLPSAPKSDDA